VREADAHLWVCGGRPLTGTVDVSGFKHSLVTLVAAACAAQAPAVFMNCPDITESHVLVRELELLDVAAELVDGVLKVDPRPSASRERLLVGKCTARAACRGLNVDERRDAEQVVHGSIYLASALVSRSGTAVIPTAGGCQIGDRSGGRRPVEHYVDVFRRFGARADEDELGQLVLSADRLSGCTIDLLDYTSDKTLQSGPLYSGATKVAVLNAVVAHGTSILHNPYRKPDVTELVDVLCAFGADIESTSSGSLIVHGCGPDALRTPVHHTLMADLIELVTWICAATLLASSPLRVRGCRLDAACTALAPELEILSRMGTHVERANGSLVVYPTRDLSATDIVIASHGVFSDSQPFVALLATFAQGASTITETVWSKRFGYAEGLRQLGCSLAQAGPTLRIRGGAPPERSNQHLHATDLRAAAVLVLAAACVDGSTCLTGIHHLARGYPDFVGTLSALGADISDKHRQGKHVK
jgi:UDP-N-acetylglucosamine enolpyruvyl transferase